MRRPHPRSTLFPYTTLFRSLNVRNALNALLKLGAVPVVNENDATATDEITFGDNDALAAQVAVLLGARLLVLLTEVEGVDRKSTRLNSSHPSISYAVFCLKK